MKSLATGFKLLLALFALSTVPAFTQTDMTDSATTAATAPVAYVYVGAANKVNLYDAAANGKLTLVKGSPFQTSGLTIGSNGKFLVTLGTNLIHSYPVVSTGAIGKQISTINTQFFSGSDCSDDGTGGAVLDHTGTNLYVYFFTEFNDGGTTGGGCASIQTYNISKAGELSFNGAALFGNNAGNGIDQIPAITGNDTYAYASGYFGIGGDPSQQEVYGFKRKSGGELEDWNPNVTPPSASAGGIYLPGFITADPANHLAISTQAFYYDGDNFQYGPLQLASFTEDTQGNIVSSNTSENMPSPEVTPSIMNMSPSGKLLALGGNGLQVFHFNGANPITPYSSVLTTAPINQIHWDNSNHLYALSDSTNKLYVYTITPTSISAVPGSPFTTIANPTALVVVPK
jgi:hypothetical protein